MYAPYLRARAEELRAINDVAALIKGGPVFPVLEPVNGTSEMWSKLRGFVKKEVPFALVVNPPYGDLSDDPKPLAAFVNEHANANLFGGMPVMLPTFHIRPGVTPEAVEAFLKDFQGSDVGFVVASDDVPRKSFERMARGHGGVVFVAVMGRLPSSYRPNLENAQVVKVEDGFHRAPANAKYPDESFFSELVDTYAQEGFDGFGDFATVGDLPPGGGFTPAAVVVHLSFEKAPGHIRVRHFVSDDRDEQVQGQVPRKTRQALVKLQEFVEENEYFQGSASSSLLDAAAGRDKLPNLGRLKRLSIRHHIELMASVVGRKSD